MFLGPEIAIRPVAHIVLIIWAHVEALILHRFCLTTVQALYGNCQKMPAQRGSAWRRNLSPQNSLPIPSPAPNR